jgi:hypothetical protein
MPTATEEKPRELRGTVPRPSEKKCNAAGQSGQEDQLSRRNRCPSPGDETVLQTPRPAKPPKLAEPPDIPGRSPAYDVTRTAMAGAMLAQTASKQGEAEACDLPSHGSTAMVQTTSDEPHHRV